MTITAEEMKAIAREVSSKREIEEQNKALKYIEETITPIIKNTSAQGKFFAVCRIDDNVSIDLVMHELSEYGFRIVRNNMYLRIMW